MTFDEYQTECLRTASMGLGPEIETCVRALGLCGELEELKRELLASDPVLVKEGGDVLWYAAALAAVFSLDGDDLGIGDLDDLECDAAELAPTSRVQVEFAQDAACRLAELVKKHVGHKKPADPLKVKILLRRVLASVASVMPVPLSEVGATNIAKLRERFKGKGFDMAIVSKKADSDETHAQFVARTVTEETPGHFPPGSMHFDKTSGDWKPGPSISGTVAEAAENAAHEDWKPGPV